MDTTRCCGQGFEFVPADNYRYPEDFPEEGAKICIIGEFSSYTEDGLTLYTLKNARFV